MSATTINPLTGKKILINGPTYNKLMEKNKLSTLKQNIVAPKRSKRSKSIPSLRRLSHGSAKKEKKVVKLKKLEGCSSFGKYKSEDSPFCGPKGGACKETFPVGTKKRMLAAIRYSRNAPNPKGIVTCAVRVGLSRNYITEEKAKQILERYKVSPSTIRTIVSLTKTPKKSPKRSSKKSVKKSPKRSVKKSLKQSYNKIKTSIKKSYNKVKKSLKLSPKKSPKKSTKKSPKRSSKKSPKRSSKKSPKRSSKSGSM